MSHAAIDFSQYEQAAPPAAIDFSQYEEKSSVKAPAFWDDPKGFLQNRAKELQQEAQHQTDLAMGPESDGKPFYERLGHRLLSLAPETAALVDKLVAGGMDWKNAIAMASGAIDPALPAAYFAAHGTAQLTGAEPGVNAGDTSPNNVQNALLAGSAVTAAAGASEVPASGSVPRAAASGARGIAKAAKVTAGVIRETATPENIATAIGGGIGATIGHHIGEPVGVGAAGAAMGRAIGKSVAKRLNTSGTPAAPATTPAPTITPTPQVEPPASAAPQPEPVAASAPEASATAPAAPNNENLPVGDNGESILRQILTGQDNKNLMKIAKSRGINVTKEAQLKASAADKLLVNKIIDDFSDDELDGIRNTYLENSRFRHQFGDIGSEAWKTMSLKTYFPDVKIPETVLKRTAAATNPAKTAKPAAATTSLEGTLQEMLKQVKAGKKLSDLSATQ